MLVSAVTVTVLDKVLLKSALLLRRLRAQDLSGRHGCP